MEELCKAKTEKADRMAVQFIELNGRSTLLNHLNLNDQTTCIMVACWTNRPAVVQALLL